MQVLKTMKIKLINTLKLIKKIIYISVTKIKKLFFFFIKIGLFYLKHYILITVKQYINKNISTEIFKKYISMTVKQIPHKK